MHYTFGAYRLDTERRELYHHGATVPLQPKMYQVLLYLHHTDGVPLYVEELTRMLLESGQLIERPEHYELDGRLEPPTMPDTLHDALMARLDRLGAAKEVTQWGAVLGREFRYDVFAAVTSYDETLLQEALTHLVGAGLVQQQGFVPAASYRFKHAVIREVAYHSVLRRRRQAMHAQVAQVLEAQFPVLVETQPEILAQHYTAAGQPAAAIPYWSRAGQQAYRRSAYVEATAHLRQALALLAPLPQTSERLAQELSLQVELGLTLSATQGYTIPEVERAYARARELCQHVEDQTQLVRALRGLMLYYQLCGQLEHAAQLGERFFRLANASSNAAARIAARHFRGTVLFLRGEPAAAQTYHQQALQLYTAQEDREALVRHSTVDSGVSAHSWLALEWWQLGYPDRAMQHCQAAHALAQELAHPASLAHTLLRAAVLHQFRRDAPAVQTQTAAVTTLATAQGLALWVARGRALHSWALAMQGHGVVGLHELRQGIAAERVWQLYFLGLLAEAYGASGHPAEGLAVLDEAMREIDTAEVRFYVAELYRLKGALRLMVEGHGRQAACTAEACFQQALAIARQQQARAWELRAATSLAWLWHRQGRHQEAYELLAPLYGWFTEGLDTADLQDAAALLNVLHPRGHHEKSRWVPHSLLWGGKRAARRAATISAWLTKQVLMQCMI